MFQLNTFHLWSKGKIILFTKHMRIKSRSYNKNKKSFSINPLAPYFSRIRKILFEFEFVHLESGLFYLLLILNIYLFFFFALFFISFRFSFPLFSFYSLPSFLKFPWVCWSCRIWPIFSSSEGYEINQIDFSIKNKKVLCEIFGFFLFLYPYPSVWINREPFLLYESILLHSNSFPIPPKENPELDPKLTG